jgi:rRNA pseudouridine-1189 N-methylase Emg1 (Nep1/Mra1 family)
MANKTRFKGLMVQKFKEKKIKENQKERQLSF